MLGIGGMGMSALAAYFLHCGSKVIGYDRSRSRMSKLLEQKGAEISYTDTPTFLPSPEELKEYYVVYTPAINRKTALFAQIEDSGQAMHKRSEALELILKTQKVIAVAGTHGKTTTSAMLANILKDAKFPFTAILGGWCNNFQGNFFTSGTKAFVVEADEYDRSFLRLDPTYALITAMDPDHLDIYGSKVEMEASFRDFIHKVGSEGKVFSKLELLQKLEANCKEISLGENSDYSFSNVTVENGKFHFDLQAPNYVIEGITAGLAGLHNVENAVSAAAIALELGLKPDEVRKGIESFNGIYRRFDLHLNENDRVFIDDYAHHPKEIDALINSVRMLFPNKRLKGIFQPHLYSRTRDFMSDFASSLEKLDELILMEIYPAREEPIPGIDAQNLLEKIDLKNKIILNEEQILVRIENNPPELLVTIGAGNIDALVPKIKKVLINA